MQSLDRPCLGNIPILMASLSQEERMIMIRFLCICMSRCSKRTRHMKFRFMICLHNRNRNQFEVVLGTERALGGHFLEIPTETASLQQKKDHAQFSYKMKSSLCNWKHQNHILCVFWGKLWGVPVRRTSWLASYVKCL